MSGQLPPVPHSPPTDSNTLRTYADKLYAARKRLIDFAQAADDDVGLYSASWKGQWKDDFVSQWDRYLSGDQEACAAAWQQRQQQAVSAGLPSYMMYEVTPQHPTAFLVVIQNLKAVADELYRAAHDIDQNNAAQVKLMVDGGIILLSVVATALSFGALAPEAGAIDLTTLGGMALVGGGIGLASGAAISFSDQMIDNAVGNDESLGTAWSQVDWGNVIKAGAEGFVQGAVFTVVSFGVVPILARIPAAGGLARGLGDALTNPWFKAVFTTGTFAAGGFLSDIAGQETGDLVGGYGLRPPDFGHAGIAALESGGLTAAVELPLAGYAATHPTWSISDGSSVLAKGFVKGDGTLMVNGGPGDSPTVGRFFDNGDGGLMFYPGNGQAPFSLAGKILDFWTPTGAVRFLNADGGWKPLQMGALSDGRIAFTPAEGQRLPDGLTVGPDGKVMLPRGWTVGFNLDDNTVRLTSPGILRGAGTSWVLTTGEDGALSLAAGFRASDGIPLKVVVDGNLVTLDVQAARLTAKPLGSLMVFDAETGRLQYMGFLSGDGSLKVFGPDGTFLGDGSLVSADTSRPVPLQSLGRGTTGGLDLYTGTEMVPLQGRLLQVVDGERAGVYRVTGIDTPLVRAQAIRDAGVVLTTPEGELPLPRGGVVEFLSDTQARVTYSGRSRDLEIAPDQVVRPLGDPYRLQPPAASVPAGVAEDSVVEAANERWVQDSRGPGWTLTRDGEPVETAGPAGPADLAVDPVDPVEADAAPVVDQEAAVPAAPFVQPAGPADLEVVSPNGLRTTPLAGPGGMEAAALTTGVRLQPFDQQVPPQAAAAGSLSTSSPRAGTPTAPPWESILPAPAPMGPVARGPILPAGPAGLGAPQTASAAPMAAARSERSGPNRQPEATAIRSPGHPRLSPPARPSEPIQATTGMGPGSQPPAEGRPPDAASRPQAPSPPEAPERPAVINNSPYDDQPSSSHGLGALREQYEAAARESLREHQKAVRDRTLDQFERQVAMARPEQLASLREWNAGWWDVLKEIQLLDREGWGGRATAGAAEAAARQRALESLVSLGKSPAAGEVAVSADEVWQRRVDANGSPIPWGDGGLLVRFDVVDHPAGARRPPRTEIVLRISWEPDAGVSAADVGRVERETRESIDHFFNLPQYTLPDGTVLEVSAQFTVGGDPRLYTQVRLRAGSGRPSAGEWFVDRPGWASAHDARAHELGHWLGLDDEYPDPQVPGRATPTSPGVHRDGSLYGELVGTPVSLKPRHLERIAALIAAARHELPATELTGGLVRYRRDPDAPGQPHLPKADTALRELLETAERLLSGQAPATADQLAWTRARLEQAANVVRIWLDRGDPAPEADVAAARQRLDQVAPVLQRLESALREGDLDRQLLQWAAWQSIAGQYVVSVPSVAQQVSRATWAVSQAIADRQAPAVIDALLHDLNALTAALDQSLLAAARVAESIRAVTRDIAGNVHALAGLGRPLGALGPPLRTRAEQALGDQGSSRAAQLDELVERLDTVLTTAGELLRQLGVPAAAAASARPSAVQATGDLVPAAEVVKDLLGSAAGASARLLERVVEADRALDDPGAGPQARHRTERALAALLASIDEAGQTLEALQLAQYRLQAEVELARSRPPEWRPRELPAAEALATTAVQDALRATLDDARVVLAAGRARLAAGPFAPMPPASPEGWGPLEEAGHPARERLRARVEAELKAWTLSADGLLEPGESGMPRVVEAGERLGATLRELQAAGDALLAGGTEDGEGAAERYRQAEQNVETALRDAERSVGVAEWVAGRLRVAVDEARRLPEGERPGELARAEGRLIWDVVTDLRDELERARGALEEQRLLVEMWGEPPAPPRLQPPEPSGEAPVPSVQEPEAVPPAPAGGGAEPAAGALPATRQELWDARGRLLQEAKWAAEPAAAVEAVRQAEELERRLGAELGERLDGVVTEIDGLVRAPSGGKSPVGSAVEGLRDARNELAQTLAAYEGAVSAGRPVEDARTAAEAALGRLERAIEGLEAEARRLAEADATLSGLIREAGRLPRGSRPALEEALQTRSDDVLLMVGDGLVKARGELEHGRRTVRWLASGMLPAAALGPLVLGAVRDGNADRWGLSVARWGRRLTTLPREGHDLPLSVRWLIRALGGDPDIVRGYLLGWWAAAERLGPLSGPVQRLLTIPLRFRLGVPGGAYSIVRKGFGVVRYATPQGDVVWGLGTWKRSTLWYQGPTNTMRPAVGTALPPFGPIADHLPHVIQLPGGWHGVLLPPSLGAVAFLLTGEATTTTQEGATLLLGLRTSPGGPLLRDRFIGRRSAWNAAPSQQRTGLTNPGVGVGLTLIQYGLMAPNGVPTPLVLTGGIEAWLDHNMYHGASRHDVVGNLRVLLDRQKWAESAQAIAGDVAFGLQFDVTWPLKVAAAGLLPEAYLLLNQVPGGPLLLGALGRAADWLKILWEYDPALMLTIGPQSKTIRDGRPAPGQERRGAAGARPRAGQGETGAGACSQGAAPAGPPGGGRLTVAQPGGRRRIVRWLSAAAARPQGTIGNEAEVEATMYDRRPPTPPFPRGGSGTGEA